MVHSAMMVCGVDMGVSLYTNTVVYRVVVFSFYLLFIALIINNTASHMPKIVHTSLCYTKIIPTGKAWVQVKELPSYSYMGTRMPKHVYVQLSALFA